jgi:predicted permease
MRILSRLRSWLYSSVRRADLDRAIGEELQFHIDRYTEDLVRAGVPPLDARRRARAEFGSVPGRTEECREALGLRLLDELRADLRYAVRLLRRSPAFTVVAVLSLGLGIGANTAIFSLIDTVLLKSLRVARPEGLFFVDNSGGKSGGRSGPPYPCYEILRDHTRYLSGMAAFNGRRFKVTIDGVQEQLRGQFASGSYFDVLGVHAAHGRVLTPADDRNIGRSGGDGYVAVISHALWARRFGMSPSVLGKTIQVGTSWVTIVGVTPPEFIGLQVGFPIDVTIPITLADGTQSPQSWWLSVVGRLQDGAAVEQARADLDAMFQAYMTDNGLSAGAREYFSGIALVPADKGLNDIRRQLAQPLLVIMGIVAIVLLIGCANVANLLLARGSARRSEIAVRLAIGAGRGRLIRQMLTEGAVLVALGTAAGILFARWGVAFLVGVFAAGRAALVLEPRFDLRVLAFTAAVAVVTGLLFSVLPALHATRVDAAKPADSARISTPGARLRVGQALVVTQVTLSLVLLCGAALFLRTLHNLTTLESGFNREGVLTMQVDAVLPPTKVAPRTPAVRAEYGRVGRMWEDLVARAASLPGVRSAGAATLSPMTMRDRGVGIAVPGAPPIARADRGIRVNHVTSGVFDALGVQLVRGRLFTPADRSGSLRVAILNETAARTYFAESNPIGRKVSFPGQDVEDEYEIVGVVRDARYEHLRKADGRMAYLPLEQSVDRIGGVILAIRGPVDPASLVPALRDEIRLTIPEGFVTNVATLAEHVDASLVQERLVSLLASFFGGLALALACIGLYGVLAYSVVRRTREIGIRLAIGAQRRSVIWLVLRETLVLIAVGVALGIPVTLAVSRYIESQLFGVSPGDSWAIAGAVAVLLLVAAAAGYQPARRASRVDPMIALRYE